MALTRNTKIDQRTRALIGLRSDSKNMRIDGTNTITLKRHKYRYVAVAKSTRTDGANTVY